MKDRLTIGSRSSNLAMIQSRYVAQRLRDEHPGLEVDIQEFSTKGDRILDKPLAEIGGKGLFTAELEAALRSGDIDLAVHSLKDLPTDDPEGLTIGAVPERANPYDAFVCDKYDSLDALPDGARIGTSSLRRKAQLRSINATWALEDIRGNVETRMRKVSEGIVDATILACAGLERIDRADAITQVLREDLMLPACAQGALGIQCREADQDVLDLLKPLHHSASGIAAVAERAFLAGLGGGCQVPIGALATLSGDDLRIIGCVCPLDGANALRISLTQSSDDPVGLGSALAKHALAQGAEAIIRDIV